MEKVTDPGPPEHSGDTPCSCHDGPVYDRQYERVVYSVLFHIFLKFPKFKVPKEPFPFGCLPCEQIWPKHTALALKAYHLDRLTSSHGQN
jgi:hypothetical protein